MPHKQEGFNMSISSVTSTPLTTNTSTLAAQNTTAAKPAADGDSAAVEAAESAGTKVAESKNAGFTPTAAAPGSVNKIA